MAARKRKKSVNNFAKFLKPQPIKVVTKKVLEKIADDIYDPKTGAYLNLCEGTLQNGPDPSCQVRTMHCGLGELYFVVTGKQPEVAGVNEDDVVEEVIRRSTMHEHEKMLQKKLAIARKQIVKLDLPEDMQSDILYQFDCYEHVDATEELRDLLNTIPDENDQGEDNAFKPRAKRVAATLRQAAKLLPR